MLLKHQNRNKFTKYILIAGLAAIVMIAGGFHSSYAEDQSSRNAPSPKVIALDTNHDGKPDQWQYYENGQIVRTEADTNFDGVVDEIGYYKDGKLVKVEKDSDYDGKMDRWVEY